MTTYPSGGYSIQCPASGSLSGVTVNRIPRVNGPSASGASLLPVALPVVTLRGHGSDAALSQACADRAEAGRWRRFAWSEAAVVHHPHGGWRPWHPRWEIVGHTLVKGGSNVTFDHRHYVPVVLTKRGERRALGDLSPSVKSHLTPLFEVAPIDWNFDLDEPPKTIDGHLSTLGPDLAACWGHDRAFVDMQFIAPTERMADGSHPPLDWLIAQANAAGVTLLPSVSPGRDVAYRAAAARAVARDRRGGACIRLTTGEWPSATGGVARLDELLRELAIAPR